MDDAESCVSIDSSPAGSPLFTPPDGSPHLDNAPPPLNIASESAYSSSTQLPPIPGLYHFNDFLNEAEAAQVVRDVTSAGYFDVAQGRDQAVLFGARDGVGGLPFWATRLVSLVDERLRSGALKLDDDAIQHALSPVVAPDCHFTRQFILNAYRPGQGIAAHIDLPNRFLDGIMILSFGTGIAMDFVPLESKATGTATTITVMPYSVYLRPRSLCILTRDSRWQWTHGIAARSFDVVCEAGSGVPRRVDRGPRLSITMRWLKLQQEVDHDSEKKETSDDVSQSALRS